MEKNDQNDQNVKQKISKENTNKGNFFFNRKQQIPNLWNNPLDRSFPSCQFKLDTLQLFVNSLAI